MQQGPQLFNVVLQGRARHQQLGIELPLAQLLVQRGLGVLQSMGLINQQRAPLYLAEGLRVLEYHLVRRDQRIKLPLPAGNRRPAGKLKLPDDLTTAAVTHVHQRVYVRDPLGKLLGPVWHRRQRHNHQRRLPQILNLGQIPHQTRALNRLSQPHLIRQNPIHRSGPVEHHPVQALELIIPQRPQLQIPGLLPHRLEFTKRLSSLIHRLPRKSRLCLPPTILLNQPGILLPIHVPSPLPVVLPVKLRLQQVRLGLPRRVCVRQPSPLDQELLLLLPRVTPVMMKMVHPLLLFAKATPIVPITPITPIFNVHTLVKHALHLLMLLEQLHNERETRGMK